MMMVNQYSQKCILDGTVQYPCVEVANRTLALTSDSTTGIELLWVTGGNLPANAVKFNAAYKVAERKPEYINQRQQEAKAAIAAAQTDENALPTKIARCHHIRWVGNVCYWSPPSATVLAERIEDDVIIAAGKKDATSTDYTPPPEPPWYVCIQATAEGLLTGIVDNMQCRIAVKGAAQTFPNYNVIQETKGLLWLPAFDGHVPATALALGWRPTNTQTYPQGNGYRNVFSCRTMIDSHTFLGWTVDGAHCNIIYRGAAKVTQNMEILSRDPQYAVSLNKHPAAPAEQAAHPLPVVSSGVPVMPIASSGIP